MTRRPLALIAGAGIGGLGGRHCVAACRLGHPDLRAGRDAAGDRVCPRPRAECGRRAARARRRRSHRQRTASPRRPWRCGTWTAASSGVSAAACRIGRQGDVPSVILRPVLHGGLLEALGPDAVEVNHAAVAFHLEGTRVRLELEDGTSATGDILIGADGVGSVIRAQVASRRSAGTSERLLRRARRVARHRRSLAGCRRSGISGAVWNPA